MSKNSLQELQTRYIAGEQLSGAAASRFLRWLRDSPIERREMLIDEAIDNQLRCMARVSDKELAERFVMETVQRAVDSQHSENVYDVVATRTQNRSRAFPLFSVPVSLCTAALVFVVVAITWYVNQVWNQNDFGFASITHAKNLSWELIDDESRRLSVSSGSGELHFENGTIAQLAAPAVVELRTPSKLFVKTGSVKMSVPPTAIGFTVETPIARIVDLGTEFDVDVGESGKTETRVRSGVVTFETQSKSRTRNDPIKLTAEGLNRASAEISELTTDIRSVTTTASGSQGRFFGMIHADGETVEFDSRQEFDDFTSRLHSSLQNNPSQFREQWKVILRTTENSTSTLVESRGGSGTLRDSPGGGAHEMLIKQLRSMQQRHQGNPQMQELLQGMIRQAGEDQEKTPQ